MSANHNQPTNNPSNLGGATRAKPTEDTSVSFVDKSFCTGKVELIGIHLGYMLGTYSNKDGSGGLFITDGATCLHIDENRNIHLQTGKTANDGTNGGNLIHRADMIMDKCKSYSGHFKGNDDDSTTGAGGETSKNPAYSLTVEGEMDIVVHGDANIAADNITLDAKEVLTLKGGNQVKIESGDGGGKVNTIASEITTTGKFVKYDLTSSFYVNGPEEITYNQKLKSDPISGSVNVNTPAAVISSNTVGARNEVMLGNTKMLSTGNMQLEGYKTLLRDFGGTSNVSLGPFVQFSVGQYEGDFIGTPRENSRDINAYTLKVGGAIGSSYKLLASDVNMDTPGTITGTSVSFVDFIGSLIFLN